MYDNLITDVQVTETEDGFRIEVKGDKERLKAMGFGPGMKFPFGPGMGRGFMRGMKRGWGRGRRHHGRHHHGHHGPHGDHGPHGHGGFERDGAVIDV